MIVSISHCCSVGIGAVIGYAPIAFPGVKDGVKPVQAASTVHQVL